MMIAVLCGFVGGLVEQARSAVPTRGYFDEIAKKNSNRRKSVAIRGEIATLFSAIAIFFRYFGYFDILIFDNSYYDIC